MDRNVRTGKKLNLYLYIFNLAEPFIRSALQERNNKSDVS